MTAQMTSPVVVDAWAQRSALKNATLVLGLSLLTAVCAQVAIPLPFTPVPLTLQTFAVLAGAAALGPQRALAAQVLYVALALVGFPVLAGGASGSTSVFGATGGYLLGFIVASYVVGAIARRGATTSIAGTVSSYVAGTATIYALGVSWLAVTTKMSMSEAVMAGMVPFLIGDAIKAFAAGIVLPSLWPHTK